MSIQRYEIGKLHLSAANIQKALQFIQEHLNQNKKEGSYVCITNTRTAYQANSDNIYLEIQNKSLMTLPDGMPLVWLARLHGFSSVSRVSGKDLMDAVFSSSVEKKYSHFFYGGIEKRNEEMIQRINTMYPGIHIVKVEAPPFQPIEQFDIEALAKQINQIKPTFFWCGLGAPKQEILISRLSSKLDSGTISIGVGLAFDYFSGTVRRAPLWMQRFGLEWLYRLIQQPNNVSRAIKPFIWMLRMLIKNIFIKNQA